MRAVRMLARHTGRPELHHVAVVRAVAAVVLADPLGEQLLVARREMLMAEAGPRQQRGEFDLHVTRRWKGSVHARAACDRRLRRGVATSAGSTRQISTSSANLNSGQYSDS